MTKTDILTSQVKLWIHLQYMEFKICKTELYSKLKVVNIFSYHTALVVTANWVPIRFCNNGFQNLITLEIYILKYTYYIT